MELEEAIRTRRTHKAYGADPVDPTTLADPLAPENLLKTSGRGIFLIRSFMDDVQIKPSQAGTEIKLFKHVHGAPAGGKEASQ